MSSVFFDAVRRLCRVLRIKPCSKTAMGHHLRCTVTKFGHNGRKMLADSLIQEWRLLMVKIMDQFYDAAAHVRRAFRVRLGQ